MSILMVAYNLDALVYVHIHSCQLCTFMVPAEIFDRNHNSSYSDFTDLFIESGNSFHGALHNFPRPGFSGTSIDGL